jgi:hypothetical protein
MKYTDIDINNEVDAVDFMPAKISMGDGTYLYGLTITLVRDEPREIAGIFTATVTDSLEEMAKKINTIMSTGMFDDKEIILKTTMIVSDQTENETVDWESYGVAI